MFSFDRSYSPAFFKQFAWVRNTHLIPGPGVLRLFDYFMTATGEESIEEIRERIVLQLRDTIPSQAAGEAEDLLDPYLTYREAARGFVAEGAVTEDLDRRMRMLRPWT